MEACIVGVGVGTVREVAPWDVKKPCPGANKSASGPLLEEASQTVG